MTVFTKQLKMKTQRLDAAKSIPHPAVFWIFSCLLILMSLVIIAGILAIVKVQIINFYMGKTTNERFSTQTEQKHVSNFQPNRGDNVEDDGLAHSQIRIE